MVEIRTLVKLTALCGCACVTTMSGYQFYITRKAEERPYFKEAVELLRKHAAAKQLLGEPVKTGFVDALSGRTYADDSNMNLYVNVMGSKIKGELYIKATLNQEEDWLLKRVELEMKDKAGGKVLIYDRDNIEEIDESDHGIH
ncbi:uncharacterized protein LOC111046677 [Nilaparvata lugens]|uniref:uncharacterized protein LOC111046677 n=1 Tax=Nilaparvata lugens TaxID=108931 RepID=UPI00193DFD31|nr:uncharacterized protein LOC111046677 [Nilaparvata lugens]XP_022187973.2 uncharacterized protein LOC111046677 [Nilaparvata lugens]XP_039277761.1 uncharacterized protein LOC111046677 [Nilaparvata lugens]